MSNKNPLIAGEQIEPGQFVGIGKDGKAYPLLTGAVLGIAESAVKKDELLTVTKEVVTPTLPSNQFLQKN